MILFVIIGIVLLRYIYSQIALPSEVQRTVDHLLREYVQTPKQFICEKAQEPDLDLLYNNVIDFDEAFKC